MPDSVRRVRVGDVEYREISAENPFFKKVWESTLAFRNDQYLWWQIAEYGYDTYLIRTRTRV